MNPRKQVVAALALAPAYVIAQNMQFNGTIVSKEEKSIKVKTKEVEKLLAVGSKAPKLPSNMAKTMVSSGPARSILANESKKRRGPKKTPPFLVQRLPPKFPQRQS